MPQNLIYNRNPRLREKWEHTVRSINRRFKELENEGATPNLQLRVEEVRTNRA